MSIKDSRVWFRVKRGHWKNRKTGASLSCDEAIVGPAFVVFISGKTVIKRCSRDEVDLTGLPGFMAPYARIY